MLLNQDTIKSLLQKPRLPSLFIGHGNPMLVLETPESSSFVNHLDTLGKRIELYANISAICVISAHWLTDGTFVNTNFDQEVIYDFGGFPDEMYQVQYPVKGNPKQAIDISNASEQIKKTNDWGLDHGAWTVLKHLFPKANIPTFQLSIDYHKPMHYHVQLASQLKQFRNEGVLFIGSGNVIHNLRLGAPRLFQNDTRLFGWEADFDHWFKSHLFAQNIQELENYLKLDTVGKLAVPTPDHYIPALYCLALADEIDTVIPTYEELLPGLSMLSFLVG
jgi:4,5-DOPA dioxygenase extradiol